MKIVVSDNQVDKALRVLKKKLIKEGLLKEMKKREYYEKPSVKRKRKEKESRKRLRKLLVRKTTPRPLEGDPTGRRCRLRGPCHRGLSLARRQ